MPCRAKLLPLLQLQSSPQGSILLLKRPLLNFLLHLPLNRQALVEYVRLPHSRNLRLEQTVKLGRKDINPVDLRN